MWLANFKSWKWLVFIIFVVVVEHLNPGMPRQQQILVDTDVDTDDIFALLYLLKLNRLEFNVKAVTINTNGWSNAGHAINHVYDLLFMMGRDDIPVGIGGEGGISQYGALFPNIGGFLPIIQQGMTTAGNCRYRQAIPLGQSGRLDTDTNYGLRKAFLPQGKRRYKPLSQATAQEVMINAISEGPTSVFLMGAHTNFAIFLMSNSQLKKNVKHIYIMGGAVNPAGGESGHVGNLFTASSSNPYAEFNLFADPFAAYQVIHSGIPVTLIPLDATNTIPITKEFFKAFEQNQKTFESQYCFKSLKMARTTFSSDKQFYANYFMWDSFMAGVAVSIMRNGPDNKKGENDFAEMEYMNITVHTSNEPYGVFDGSNPFFTQHYSTPKFHLNNHGVHSGHVQMSLRDPFCLAHNNKLGCKDGYTEEVSGPEGVRILVAKRAKPNKDPNNILDKEFFSNFLHVLNEPHQSGRLNLTTQFPEYKEVLHKQDLGAKKVVRPVIFDMDMSAGDFLALFYLLKVPIQELNLQAILVTPTGWANAATIDVVYDVLHMMGRDDIQVGLGPVFGMNQSYSFSLVGDCKYVKAIPHGSGGFLDSDTLYGFARDLPRSPRRYMAKNLQPLAVEVWENVTKGSKTRVTILTNGPLTTLAKILDTDKKAFSKIQDVYVVGGHINTNNYTSVGGNLFTVPSNIKAEFNIFLDPLSAKMVIESKLPITLIPWESQQCVTSFDSILEWISHRKKTPEAHFAYALLSKLSMLRKQNHRYQHVDLFLGEILGAVILANGKFLNSTFDVKLTKVLVRGKENIDGQMIVDTSKGTPIKVLKDFDGIAYYGFFADRLGDEMNNNNL